MKLTVLNVAYPFAPVGPDAVGGAEQILTHLDAALTRAGHDSIVIAQEGSRVSRHLLAVPQEPGQLSEEKQRRMQHQHRIFIESALRQWRVNVIHLHGVDFYKYLPCPGIPTLVTLHLPATWYPREVFCLNRPSTYLHCVSRTQRHACPPCNNLLPEIENGVALESSNECHAKRRFVVALGRVCPEKGFHVALEAATRARIPLLLVGKVYAYATHELYFEQEIKPRLGKLHYFIGPAGLKRKRRLLSAARCLLVPSLVEETSSLVAMEALSYGTPVVAFPVGALPEIIDHGITGFLVKDEEEMAAAIEAAGTLDPEACRAAARTRFSSARMTGQYLQRYQELANEQIISGIYNEGQKGTARYVE
ncbi:MAG: glycosyl transferase family 1 [Pedosphaera sp.]|nr:glycosyl transferase family 1 [Pedosphaera sp.]